jgi:hypothetical protein
LRQIHRFFGEDCAHGGLGAKSMRNVSGCRFGGVLRSLKNLIGS